MTTYYYNNLKDHGNNTVTTTITTTEGQHSPPQPSHIPNNLGNKSTWLMTPLSPPLGKMEFTGTSGPTPLSTVSTPNHRRPCINSSTTTPAWHSLWTSSTWHQQQHTYHTRPPMDEQTSPIDLDFLDSPSEDDIYHYQEQQRSQPISVLPITAAIDDCFQLKKNNNQSAAGATAISSPILRRSSFQQPLRSEERSKSIWDLNYPPSTFFPVSSLSPKSSRDERRHSIAVVTHNRPISPPPATAQQQQIQQLIQQVQQQQKIDEYFSPTCTQLDVSLLGKGLPLNQLKDQIIYQVQFKVKYRTDYFYVLEKDTLFKLNDKVMVEADRGYDIGTIIQLIETKEQRKKKKSLLPDHTIKRIFRLANPAELITYELKIKDEQKALIICQAKIEQKNLNMEVVEAEYQWDRRKLTFYFKANERIDFRELVREVFKIYKTRIWMCASSLE